MKVDLTTKVLCLKASFHFLIISNLFFLLTFGLTVASVYAYFTCPKEILGLPLPDENLNKMKEDVIMKALGGITLIPFVVLSFLTGFMSCIKYTPFFALCTLISLGLAVGFLGYDCYVLFYLKLKYVWPPQMLQEVQIQIPGSPITTEDTLIHFTKILIGTVTFAMFAVVSILLYCSFISANLSFLYKSPEPAPRPRHRVPIRRRLEEEDETDEDENEEKKEDAKKSDDKGKEEGNDEKKEEKGKDKTQSEKGTGTQTGTGTGAD